MSAVFFLPSLVMAVSLVGIHPPTIAATPPTPSFRYEVLPVLARAGCNSGKCHGHRGGKGGFQLSLWGYDPEADYRALTRDAGGRRIDLTDVPRSLVLRKPSQQMAHGGGQVLSRDSTEYATLQRWLAAGAPHDPVAAPRLVALEIQPPEILLTGDEPPASANETDGATLVETPDESAAGAPFPLRSVAPPTELAAACETDAARPARCLALVFQRRSLLVECAVSLDRSHVSVAPAAAQMHAPRTPLPSIETIVASAAPPARWTVWAHFSDQSIRDVTRQVVWEPGDVATHIDADGTVTRDRLGEGTVLVRFGPMAAVARVARVPPATMPRPPLPTPRNLVDELVFTRLAALGLRPSPRCEDHVFLRRVSLDLLGRLPTPAEARAFVADTASDKRQQCVAMLLERREFSSYWAQHWMDLLRAEEKVLDRKGVQTLFDWLERQWLEHRPWNEVVRELITAQGSTYQHPPANFYRALRDPSARAEAAAQVFLGIRLQCARCHQHPSERWTQDDYYGWAALFAQVDYKVLENRRQDPNDPHEFDGEQIVLHDAKGEVKDPRSGRPAPPACLGALPLDASPATRRLEALAEWLTAPDNRQFARAQANRVWYHLLGRGIVEPVDDFRLANPATNEPLLEALADHLIAHDFDLRHLIRLIVDSHTYQASSTPNATNAHDETHFSHALVRRLSAEQLLDALHDVCDIPTQLNGYPDGQRACTLPGVEAIHSRHQPPSPDDQFLKTFGKPARLMSSECERSQEVSLAQSLALLAGPVMNQLLTHRQGRLGRALAENSDPLVLADELYWSALSRSPQPGEYAYIRQMMDHASQPRQAWEDVLWALLNSQEFLLRR